MKRLEETVQRPLFHRDGRRLVLTPAGETLLDYAREMLAINDRALASLSGDVLVGPARIGMVQDFAEVLLSGVLAQFADLNPETHLQIRVGGSLELLELLETDRLDIVLGMGPEDDKAAIRTAPMQWLGEARLTQLDVLPLAILERPCRFRDAALAALDQAGAPYRVVLETPSLSVLRAAIESGLGVSCRTDVFSSKAIEGSSLPPLPHVAYVRHSRPRPHPTIARLIDLISSAVLDL
jgi:DNA-binding transcriptional LysR family regulator